MYMPIFEVFKTPSAYCCVCAPALDWQCVKGCRLQSHEDPWHMVCLEQCCAPDA